MRRAASAVAISRVTIGEIVLWSTHTVPGAAPWITPFSPSSTSRTSSDEVTLVNTTLAPRAASAGVKNGSAPSARADSAASGRRTKARTVWPAASRCRTMWEPMAPRPMKATVRAEESEVGAVMRCFLFWPAGAGAGCYSSPA